ncbi:MAG: ATP synthase F1 subunit gamma [Oscillospiraceae bacterium]|nr:ATP synthase F1 subunit gamma [Oscillospiraceae bacterium]
MASGNMKSIKRRIKSVESTLQITKAMEVVSSSKLRKAKEKADSARPFFDALYQTMCEIQSENTGFLSPYIGKREAKNVMLIVIAGDRGLAGGFNSNITKMASTHIKELEEQGCKVKILAIGKKSAEYFSKHGYDIAKSYINVGQDMKINHAAVIADDVVVPYLNGEIDRVEIFSTEFISTLSQEARFKPILPLEISDDKPKLREIPIYEPSPEAVFNAIVPKYITGIIYSTVVDSFAAEQAARRTAMENASDNANEMISHLSLVYNRARQSSITQEITEIVGGASAQE